MDQAADPGMLVGQVTQPCMHDLHRCAVARTMGPRLVRMGHQVVEHRHGSSTFWMQRNQQEKRIRPLPSKVWLRNLKMHRRETPHRPALRHVFQGVSLLLVAERAGRWLGLLSFAGESSGGVNAIAENPESCERDRSGQC